MIVPSFDNYLNITRIAKDLETPKSVRQWAYQVRNTPELAQIASNTGYPEDWLIWTREGRGGGTYVHPEVYQLFKQWVLGNSCRRPPNVVYLISAAGVVKVGITKDIKRRLKRLQAHSPVKLQVLRMIKTAYASDIEAEIHCELSAKLNHSEWFNMTDEEALVVFERICSKYL